MLVKSILFYNYSTWGMTIQDEQQLGSFYKKQLRRILNIRWPHKIRKKNYMKKPIQNLYLLRRPGEDGTYLDISSD